MKVVIPIKVYQELRTYAKSVETEISGMGKVEVRPGDVLYITEICLIEQVSTASTTQLDKGALAKFYDKLMQKNEDMENWKVWWHSHADMDVFWSGPDDTNINEFDTQQKEDNWFLSIVVNQKDELLARLDIFHPFRITMDNLEWVLDYDDVEIEERIKEEVRQKVSGGLGFTRNVFKKAGEAIFGEKEQVNKYFSPAEDKFIDEEIDETQPYRVSKKSKIEGD